MEYGANKVREQHEHKVSLRTLETWLMSGEECAHAGQVKIAAAEDATVLAIEIAATGTQSVPADTREN
jgi:hypothetical protein